MKRRIIGVTAAALLATGGTSTLVAWAGAAEDRALAGERTVDVLVVREAIAEGTRAEDLASRVEVERVPSKVQALGSVADLTELEGKVVAVDLVPGEQLMAARFADPEVLARQTGVEVPDGLQEVTVLLEPQRAVGGNVRAGDTVGLVASFEPFETDEMTAEGTPRQTPNTTHMILHKLLVTRVQAAPSTESREDAEGDVEPLPSSDLLVTLAVDAPSVERVVFAQEFGFVWLTAEPETATEDGTTIQTRGTIYQ